MTAIPALGGWKKENWKFKDIVDSVRNSRSAWAIQNLVSKPRKANKMPQNYSNIKPTRT